MRERRLRSSPSIFHPSANRRMYSWPAAPHGGRAVEEGVMEVRPIQTAPGAGARIRSQLEWYWTLSPPGRAAFWATFGGWALDAYNQMTLGFVLPAVTATFGLSDVQGGLIGTVGGVTSAIGGALAGALADTIGRVRVLLLSIGSYALFTLLAGCAQSYEQLLVFRTLQGLGFGGEWAAGAVLVSEYAEVTQRGRVVGAVQSAWSVGFALVLVANAVAFSLAPPELAWRIMFWLGAVPAVALFWTRTRLQESPIYCADAAARAASAVQARARQGFALLGLFRRDQLRVTLASALLSIGVIGAGVAFWLPTYLEQVRHLTVEGIGAYMGIQVVGGAAAWRSSRWAARSPPGPTLCCRSAPPGWCSPSDSPSGSSVQASSAVWPSTSPNCTRLSCAARGKGSATTSAGGSVRSGRPRWASRRRMSG